MNDPEVVTLPKENLVYQKWAAENNVSVADSARICARVLADSINPAGTRIVTIEANYPRSIHAEVMTHRVFCLAGDAKLEFDLPGGGHGGRRRVYTMPIADFVDRWHNGARRIGAKPKRAADLSILGDDVSYAPLELARAAGMSSQMNINAACRSGVLNAEKADDGRTWLVQGRAFKQWRQSAPEHTRFDMRERLAFMQIRQLDESNGRIAVSTVRDCCESGVKRVYEVKAGRYSVTGSQDHQVMTPDGYLPIGALVPGRSQILVRRFGKLDDQLDPIRLKKINGRWRSTWQRDMREKMVGAGEACVECGSSENLHVHHRESVLVAPELAFDPTNVVLLCQSCHTDAHRVQGWQGGTYLYGDIVTVDSVTYRSNEQTYDLEIAGDYPNYLANGVVVHNSRNTASSRAIPLSVTLRKVTMSPFLPLHWGKNQKGMQSGAELEPGAQKACQTLILGLRGQAVETVKQLSDWGIHKQLANRYLEPWMWHTAIITSTEWLNFLHLRKHPDAEPHIADLAEAIYEAIRLSKPIPLRENQWHLPLIQSDEDDVPTFLYGPAQGKYLAMISGARCARTSYLTHAGKRDTSKDVALYHKLLSGGHMSPLEHAAQATKEADVFYGNLRGWKSLRYQIPGEWDILGWRGEVERLEGLEGLH